jgi:hypothetical protein
MHIGRESYFCRKICRPGSYLSGEEFIVIEVILQALVLFAQRYF